jgi:tetratricopeptide (TPR) repeat protein
MVSKVILRDRLITIGFLVFLLPFAPVLAQDANSLVIQAKQLEHRGQTDAAIVALKEADNLSPGNPEIQKVLARQYIAKVDDVADTAGKKQYAQMALDLAQKALDQLPKDSEALLGAAAAYGKLCDFVDSKTKVEYSKKVYAEATVGLRLDPSSDFGHLILAKWNLGMVTINPLMKGMAQVLYGQLPDASKEAAIYHFKKAIELAPQRIIHHAEFAHALDLMGDKEGARQQWMEVGELRPVYEQDQRYQASAAEHLR